MRILRNFIGGQWRDSAGGRVKDCNPADVTDVIAEAPASTAAEAAEACDAALRAFEGWRQTPEVRPIRCSPFPLRVPQYLARARFPPPATSNRTCGLPASGSPTTFDLRRSRFQAA